MAIFYITKWTLDYKTQEEEGLRMSFTMRRKVMSELMTTYFPSLLLTAITFATTFFKPFFFEAALSVNLTTMLVMTTIFISKMESLPPTSDIKMIDIWLILCQMVPFAEVVLLTAMEYNREEKKKRKKAKRGGKTKRVQITTAMEYKGEEKKKRKKAKRGKKTKGVQITSLTVAPLDKNMMLTDENGTRRLYHLCVRPSLKTVGEYVFFF